jgi:hypothetical protein
LAASHEKAKLELKALMPEDAKQAITAFAPSAPNPAPSASIWWRARAVL